LTPVRYADTGIIHVSTKIVAANMRAVTVLVFGLVWDTGFILSEISQLESYAAKRGMSYVDAGIQDRDLDPFAGVGS